MKYSVLMSVYYKEKPEYLIKSLKSMLAQTILPDQIVLVKDGPLTEELDLALEECIKAKPEIFEIVSLEKNGGLGNALNVGLAHCKNELVARMDSDDISMPTRCEKQLKEFVNDEKLDIVGTQINEFIEDPNCVISARVVPSSHEEIIKFAKRRSPFNHPTVMYRKSVVLKNDGYATSGRKEDLELFVKMLNNGARAKNIDEALLLYRSNKDNLKRRKSYKNCKEYISIMRKFYKKKYCSLWDYLYVCFGQMIFFLMPTFIVKFINNKILRKKPLKK